MYNIPGKALSTLCAFCPFIFITLLRGTNYYEPYFKGEENGAQRDLLA